ncbi:cytochrome b-c1 complex subunit 2, mitochondrial [Phymastichus coffea]|uniref:cytochrome b-c1 complex subunit 2, mitochondrial n=1 Tax=Phymastichus coffea TaxID=108790 RepID=UPI00273BF80F|nr:cytochrome b-c1 complex subunit 2, mitochondrial [Phymastichus coffea]
MACSIIRHPLWKTPMVRNYAVAAAASAAQQCPSSNTSLKILDNKITIASIENNNPVTQISVIFKAGSRNETYDTQGISHMLRICTGLTSNGSSSFGITRNIQQVGGDLTAVSDREHISYTLKVTRNNLSHALKFLEDVATGQLFRPWEILDEIPRLKYEVSTVPDFVRVIELLYKAAYRDGLGYSLYCPKRQIGKLGSETLRHFVSNFHTGFRCAVTASGIPIAELETFASLLKVSTQHCENTQSHYHGGEMRKERNSQLASVAVAVEGASLKNFKEAIAFAVLQKVAGDGPKVKWGNCNAPLHKAVASAGQEPFAVSAFNASHTDSGLFGFILSAPGQYAGSLTQAGVKWLKSPQFSDCDVARGKADLKTLVLSAGDSQCLTHENIGLQALFSGSIISADTIAAEIDKISVADIKSVASKVAKGKLSMSAIGDLSTVPYVDQL